MLKFDTTLYDNDDEDAPLLRVYYDDDAPEEVGLLVYGEDGEVVADFLITPNDIETIVNALRDGEFRIDRYMEEG